MNRVARLMRRVADARLSHLGLMSGYLPVVTALMEKDGLTQKALVGRAAIEQPTMVNTLARMERDGIIERRPDPIDRRSVRFFLTASTRERLPEIRSAIQAFNAEAVESLTVEERVVLDKALATMATSLEAALR